jgi:hypothetical protein
VAYNSTAVTGTGTCNNATATVTGAVSAWAMTSDNHHAAATALQHTMAVAGWHGQFDYNTATAVGGNSSIAQPLARRRLSAHGPVMAVETNGNYNTVVTIHAGDSAYAMAIAIPSRELVPPSWLWPILACDNLTFQLPVTNRAIAKCFTGDRDTSQAMAWKAVATVVGGTDNKTMASGEGALTSIVGSDSFNQATASSGTNCTVIVSELSRSETRVCS